MTIITNGMWATETRDHSSTKCISLEENPQQILTQLARFYWMEMYLSMTNVTCQLSRDPSETKKTPLQELTVFLRQELTKTNYSLDEPFPINICRIYISHRGMSNFIGRYFIWKLSISFAFKMFINCCISLLNTFNVKADVSIRNASKLLCLPLMPVQAVVSTLNVCPSCCVYP